MPQKKKKSKKTPTASALSVRIAYVLGGVLGFLIIFQMIQFYELSSKLDFIDSLQDSQTKVIEQVSLSQSYLTEFASDLNQIREFLLLPTTDYNFTGIENELVFEEEQEDITTQVFNLVSALGEAEERESIYQSKKFNIDAALETGIESLDIVQTESLDGTVWKFVEQTSQTEVLELTLLYTGGVEYQMYHADISWAASDDIEDVLAELEIFPNELSTILLLIEKNKEVQAFYEGTLFPSEAFQNYLSENNLRLNTRTLTDEGGEYHLMNSDGIRLASFNNHYASGNGVIVITETDTRQDIGMDSSEITTVLNFLNENIDTRTDLEVKLDERKIELSQLMVDRGFISTMESLGMTMGELVEEETRLYYPILNEEGIVLRHLVLNYSTGELSVELPDTGSEESLAEAILNLKNNSEKKTFDLPEIILASEGLVDDPESFNILLMGKHGSNVDTIIFANVNSNSRQVTLVSIPRDLWVDGRKINSYYGEFGLVQQVKTIESVLGHKIHKYILIDMYIFRDVIDLMEGVTVVLEEDLVDPTYKTCDEGVCSTLYYEAGEHHLDGTEALRIARSRYSTSDYSRAARQQIILEGIQEKARSLGFGDANALIDIMSTVLNSTETDISLDEAMRYYFRYQNFDLNRGYVLSPANVLDAVPEPVDYVTSHAIEVCLDETNPNTCTIGYALDTLQPREENWDLIPWFISSVL